MRIVFASVGNFGHIFPLLPLAQAARAAGHEVWFATGDQFHPILSKAGLQPVTAGRSVPEAFIEAAGGQAFLEAHGGEVQASDLSPEALGALSIKAFGSVLPRWVAADLATAFETIKPDLVVHEVMNSGAAFAARLAGVPAVCHGIGRFSSNAEELAVAAEVAATAADLGVEVKDGQVRTLNNPYVDICPPSLQDPGFLASGHRRVEQRVVPFSEPGDLPAHVKEGGKPLVYLSLGTALGSAEVLRTAIDGLLPLDVRVLVATGPVVPVEALGELPDSVVALPWVPQPEALTYASLVIHHGGAGTTLASLAAGLPQLILPQAADGPDNAEGVRGTGAGDVLAPADLSAEAVTAGAKRILAEDAYRDAARKVAAEIAAMPEPAETAARLGEFVR